MGGCVGILGSIRGNPIWKLHSGNGIVAWPNKKTNEHHLSFPKRILDSMGIA